MIILSIAWKNVWRNRKRSIIVMIAVMLGTTAGVFTSGLMMGWINQRLNSVINTEIGHIKIHNTEFLNNEEISKNIPEIESLNNYLKKSPEVKSYSNRIKLMSMASTSRGTTALMLHGVNVAQEIDVSDINKLIIPASGTFLNEDQTYPIVISDKTAEVLRIKSYQIDPGHIKKMKKEGLPDQLISKLTRIENNKYNTKNLFKKELSNILTNKEADKYGKLILENSEHYRLRSKIIFTFNDLQGELVNQSFRVCGIYKTSNTMFDQINAFVLKNDLINLTGLDSTTSHETAVILNDEKSLKSFQSNLRKEFPDLSVLNWLQLSPDAGMLAKYMDFFYVIIMGFILFALSFGIINTMLMAILERTKEIGMLMAIGMNKKRIFSMIMLETIFLTMAGAIAGMVTGWAIIKITGKTGLDFSSVGEGFEAMGWASKVYPEISLLFFLGVTLLVILTGILSSIIPALKALKLNPTEAIKTDN